VRRQAHITLVNDIETSALDIADRGVAYGDGVFETMRVVAGKIPLLKWHLDRFSEGVSKLELGSPQTLKRDFKSSVNQALKRFSGDALVKVIVTRGSGGVGYLPPKQTRCSFVVQVFDLPDVSPSYVEGGVSVTLCDYRLAHQPRLAGIKHLNRLDQVLAARELNGQQEGLLFDQQGVLVEGLKSNVLVFKADQILTPSLELCGVRGTLRQYLIDKANLDIEEAKMDASELMEADGIALINSVFGIWPVAKIDGQAFESHQKCETIRQLLNAQLGFK